MERGKSFALLISVLIVGALFSPTVARAQTCQEKRSVTEDVVVYQDIPQFRTGRGWDGRIIASLRKGSIVFVCRRQSVQFGLTSRAWLQVAFQSSGSDPAFGWIPDDATTVAARSMATRVFANLSPLAAAIAQEPEPQTGEHLSPSWPPKNPPPVPPITIDTSTATPKSPVQDVVALYWPMFLAMVFGMLAKAGADWLDRPSGSSAVSQVRSLVLALLVSPIVFLGFLNVGQFSVETQAYLVLLLLAFQNGFFWQTVLKKSEPAQGNSARQAGT